MTTWQRSAPSNQTTPTHQHNSQVEDSPSDPPELLEEETLEFQAEYPQEEAEEVEEVEEVVEAVEEEEGEFPLQYLYKQPPPMEGINSLVTHHSYSQEIARNQKRS